MNIYNMDFTNEQIKILKIFYKHKSIKLKELTSYIPEKNINRCIDFLRQNYFLIDNFQRDNYGNYMPSPENDKISITCAGENAYLIYRNNKKQFIKELFLSKWCDIVVAFITSVIVNVNWDCIVSFITKLFTK